MGDYMRLEYLSSCLKNHLDFDTRKFVLVKLSGLFETKGMFLDAGRMMKSAAEINTNKQSKINDFVKGAELFIRGGDYDKAEISMRKALSLADEKQTTEIKNSVKEFYKTQARSCIEKNKRKQAVEVYEKYLTMQLDETEREEIRKKLLNLYEEIGDFVKYGNLKKRIDGLG